MGEPEVQLRRSLMTSSEATAGGGYFGAANKAIRNVLTNGAMLAGAAYAARQALGQQALRSALRTGPGAIAAATTLAAGSAFVDAIGDPEFTKAMGALSARFPREVDADTVRMRNMFSE
jgi:hypothetical protein